MLITTDQIRAARALLNWSQAELAQQTGLARPTIVKIENGSQLPEMRTLQKIVDAFSAADIEFGAHESVRRKNEDIVIYRGQQEFMKFFEAVLEYAKETGGRIFVSNVDERPWINTKGAEFDTYYANKIRSYRKRLDFRILIKEGDMYMPAEPYATYRWTPEKHFAGIPFHVYGNCLSVFLFLDEPIIISIRNQAAADLYKEKFLIQWAESLKPPVQKRKIKGKIMDRAKW